MQSAEQQRQIIRLIRRGQTIADVSETLGLTWHDVSSFLDSVDRTSWLGAKLIITTCLRDMASQDDPLKRQDLVDRADYWIDMLYYDATRLGKMVDQSLKDMDTIMQALDS